LPHPGQRGEVTYPLDKVLLFALPAVLAKDSLRLKRKVAAWEEDFLASIIPT